MKLDRKEVELAQAQFYRLGQDMLAELCKAWLALDAAPVGEVGYLCTDDVGAECHVYRREKFPAELIDRTVRLVATSAPPSSPRMPPPTAQEGSEMSDLVLKPDQLEFLQELAENSVSGHFVWKYELLELVRVYEVVMSAPRGLVEQAWTRKVTHEVTMDVMGGSIEMSGRTYRLVDEGKLIGTPQREGGG